MRIKSSAVELLEVLLEETSELSCELVYGISQDIDVHRITLLMHQLWQFQQKCDDTKEEHLRDETRKSIYRAFHAIQKVADNLGLNWKDLESKCNYRLHHSGENELQCDAIYLILRSRWQQRKW